MSWALSFILRAQTTGLEGLHIYVKNGVRYKNVAKLLHIDNSKDLV
jgi:hypothetical protein